MPMMQQQQQQQRHGKPGSLLPMQVQVHRQQFATAHTVVIVDMQTSFPAACNPKLQERVDRLIQHARSLNWPIVVLKVKGRGDLVEIVAAALRDYELVEFTEKETTSGAQKVMEACQKRAFGTGQFLVCGVNTSACVLETVKGLAFGSGRPMVATLMDACGDEITGDWFQFPEAANVSLIPSLDRL